MRLLLKDSGMAYRTNREMGIIEQTGGFFILKFVMLTLVIKVALRTKLGTLQKIFVRQIESCN